MRILFGTAVAKLATASRTTNLQKGTAMHVQTGREIRIDDVGDKQKTKRSTSVFMDEDEAVGIR